MLPRPPQETRANHPVLGGGFAIAAALVGHLFGVSARAEDWRQAEPFAAVAASVADWLDEPNAVAAWRDAVATTQAASRVGDALLAAASQADERIAAITEFAEPPEWLAPSGRASASLRLAVAERLATQRRYDACLAWLEGLDPEKVYSADLLHYLRGVASSQLVDDEAAAESLAVWADLEESQGLARLGASRWWVVRELLARSEQEAKPLPTVVRRMDDLERRLSLDDAGPETLDRQQRVLDDLDKLIEELEEQRRQQQQQQAAAGGAGGAGPNSPAEESRPSELKGPGEIDPKRLVKGDPWGSLPPAERRRLTQAITRDLPPHYRGLVEDYFRTLADGDPAPATEEGR